MAEETVHESRSRQSRKRIASYFRRIADAFDDDGPVPVDESESVTVDPPEEPELEIGVEREDGMVELEFEIGWSEENGNVNTGATGSKATFEMYEDASGKWRWRLCHDNGNIIADSGEGYTTKASAKNGIESVKKNAPGGRIEEQ